MPRRQFGGVGMMIERPGIGLTIRSAPRWSADGPHADRAVRFGQLYCTTTGIKECFAIQIAAAAPEHTGLGTGTQLGLAVARGIAEMTHQSDTAACQLAPKVGRGLRSALGVHGFDRGGFLVEGGKNTDRSISPLVARCDFPDDWHILLITPRDLVGMHSQDELQAFASLSRQAPDDHATEALCRLVLLGIIPALVAHDLDSFGEAVYDFNRRAGALFKAAQGGIYADPRIESIIKTIRLAGVTCVGQSSWGPTVFAIAQRESLLDLQGGMRMLGVANEQMVLTKACKHGVVIGA